MGTLKKYNPKVELVRNSLEFFCLDQYRENPEEEKPVFFHHPLRREDILLEKIKRTVNGHAFKGGVKNSFHVVRKEGNLNSTIKERRGEISNQSIREAFVPFSEMEHKNQLLRTVRGIKFIDDSSSVNINSTWFALEVNQAPIVLITGEVEVDDYQIIFDLVKEKVKAIAFFGNHPEKAHQIFGNFVSFIFHAEDMKEAVEMSYRLAVPGDTVLLSPACSSLDMFENYEDRGGQFEKYILTLD